MNLKTLLISVLSSLALALGLAHASDSTASPLSYELFAKLYSRLMAGENADQISDAIPSLAANLETARQVSARYWTDSTPFDELAHSYILPEKVLDALGIRHEMTAGVMHVPAGLMHSYGYLFSQLQTSFGLKGKRWIESRLDERLGLPAGAFSPFGAKGEFLSNLTTVLAQYVGLPTTLPMAASLKPSAKLAGRVVEHVEWKTPEGETRRGDVITMLIDLLPVENALPGDAKLLVYYTKMNDELRFVTAFPIDNGFAASIMASAPGTNVAFKPRFNLYIDPRWQVVSHASEGFVPAMASSLSE